MYALPPCTGRGDSGKGCDGFEMGLNGFEMGSGWLRYPARIWILEAIFTREAQDLPGNEDGFVWKISFFGRKSELMDCCAQLTPEFRSGDGST